MILTIAVPACAGAAGNSVIEVEHLVPAQQQAIVNLRVADPAVARKLRVYVECGGQKRELIDSIAASTYAATMARMIAAGLNAPREFVDDLDGFEQRLLTILLAGSDCLLSADHISRALEAFYEGFAQDDIHQAVAAVREKMARARLAVLIAGEPESGYRLQSALR